MALKETGRWLAKKAARKATVLGSGRVRRMRRVNGPTSVRVVTYHRFADAERDAFSVSPAAFDEQMRWLSEQGLAVSLSQVERFVSGHEELREGSVLVTIDDGSLSVHTHAAPILKKYKVPSVAYIASAAVGCSGADYDMPEPFMTWEQIAELPASGVEIGSHSHSHRSFGELNEAELRAEAEQSKEMIEGRLERECSSFAYPFGTQAHFSGVARSILKGTGYRSVFTSVHGSLQTGMDPLELPRVKVEGGESLWMFQQLVNGGMDAWKYIDGTLSAVIRAKRLAG